MEILLDHEEILTYSSHLMDWIEVFSDFNVGNNTLVQSMKDPVLRYQTTSVYDRAMRKMKFIGPWVGY